MTDRKEPKREREQMAEIPIAFRVESNIHDFIEEEMIKRREFNKSKIHREIFLLGLAEYKKKHQH